MGLAMYSPATALESGAHKLKCFCFADYQSQSQSLSVAHRMDSASDLDYVNYTRAAVVS